MHQRSTQPEKPNSMAINPSPFFPILLLLLLLITEPTPTHSSSFQNQTVVSLGHSLMTAVADLRASRGDVNGSHRAQLIGKQLERGLWTGLLSFIWAVGRESAGNYAWRDVTLSNLRGVVSKMNKLLCRTESDAQKAVCVWWNYQKVLSISKFLFSKAVHQSETMREVLKTVEKEVLEGELLVDCLELGGNELIKIFPDWAQQIYSSSHNWLYDSREKIQMIEDPDDIDLDVSFNTTTCRPIPQKKLGVP